MPEFICRVAYPTGEVTERTFTAADEASLRRELADKDLLVLSMRRRSSLSKILADLFSVRPRISMREFLIFNQEFRALLRAGLPVLTALDILLERRKHPAFRRALADIRDRVKSGESLSEAFAAQGDLFPRLYASSLASGERSGEIPSVLDRYVTYMGKVLEIRRKIISVLIYPVILLCMTVGLVGLMVFYIIPKFQEFLTAFGTDLPLITQIVVDTALFCRNNWLVILASLVGAMGAFVGWQRSGAGREVLDRLKLRLPLVGSILHNWAQNRFTRTLATLTAGGIPMVPSLELAAPAVGNRLFERRLFEVAKKVREGQALWESLEQTGLFSDITIEMTKVGESTGALEEMLLNASQFTEEEIDQRLTRTVALFEPLMIVVMAVVVGGMLLAIYLPLLRSYSTANF